MSSPVQWAICASSLILTATLPSRLYYLYFCLGDKWDSERLVKQAIHCPDIPSCLLNSVKILKDILDFNSVFSISFQLQVQPSMELPGAPTFFSPAGTLCWHCPLSPAYSTWRIPFYNKFKDHKRLLRILWKCWWLDPIWYSLLKAAWDIISSAYMGMIAFCRIAHYVNTLILLFFFD